MRLYQIYEEDRLIFTGTNNEVKERFGFDTGLSKYAEKNYKLLGIYTVKVKEFDEEIVDNCWECLYMMLVVRKEKKTTIVKNPEQYVDRLREFGVEVSYYPYWSIDCNDTDITAPRIKRKKQKCWMVERI